MSAPVPSPSEPQLERPSSPSNAANIQPQNEKKKVYIGNYKVGKTLGEGSFAKVKLAVHCLTGQKVSDFTHHDSFYTQYI